MVQSSKTSDEATTISGFFLEETIPGDFLEFWALGAGEVLVMTGLWRKHDILAKRSYLRNL